MNRRIKKKHEKMYGCSKFRTYKILNELADQLYYHIKDSESIEEATDKLYNIIKTAYIKISLSKNNRRILEIAYVNASGMFVEEYIGVFIAYGHSVYTNKVKYFNCIDRYNLLNNATNLIKSMFNCDYFIDIHPLIIEKLENKKEE